jgi:hypothetical protein
MGGLRSLFTGSGEAICEEKRPFSGPPISSQKNLALFDKIHVNVAIIVVLLFVFIDYCILYTI